MKTQRDTTAIAGAVTAVTLLVAGTARAAPCADIPNAPKIVIESGDTQEPLLKTLGKKLADSATPLRILWISKSTCLLAADLYTAGGVKIPDTTPVKYVPTKTEDPTWDPSKDAPTCDLPTGGLGVDLGIGATFISSCQSVPQKPANIGKFTGPIQGYGFIVPSASSQVAITAEEGYLAFGFPQGTGEAPPWTDQSLRFIRKATASTALTCSAAIGVDASKLQGVVLDPDRSGQVLNAVIGAANPEAAIGLMGVEIFDANRDKVKLLALKGFGQRYGYYPDSTRTSFDKRNLRDGHYLGWSPTEYMTPIGGDGNPTNANVKRFMDLVFGLRVDPDVNGLQVAITKGLIPRCAMTVQRAFDGANLELYSDPEPCGCFYDATVPQGTTQCAKCTDDSTCGGGKCRFGYCEAR